MDNICCKIAKTLLYFIIYKSILNKFANTLYIDWRGSTLYIQPYSNPLVWSEAPKSQDSKYIYYVIFGCFIQVFLCQYKYDIKYLNKLSLQRGNIHINWSPFHIFNNSWNMHLYKAYEPLPESWELIELGNGH